MGTTENERTEKEKAELIQDKLDEVFDNAEVMEKIDLARTPEELIKVFQEQNIQFEDVTPEEVFSAFHKQTDDELSEDELEDVSGGFAFKFAFGKLAISLVAGGGAGAFLAVAGGAALIGVASYYAIKRINKKYG